jgi:hypothetical protein
MCARFTRIFLSPSPSPLPLLLHLATLASTVYLHVYLSLNKTSSSLRSYFSPLHPPPPPQDGSRWYWPLHLPVASFIRGILAAVGGYNDLRTRSLGSEDSGESGSSTKLKSQSSASSAGPLMALLAFEALLLMLYVADESRDYNATSVWCNSHSH